MFPYLDYLQEAGELEKKSSPKPPLDDYTTEAEKLDQVLMALLHLDTRIANALSDKKHDVPKIPLPETSRARWERQRRKTKIDDLVAEVKEAQQRWVERNK